MNLLAGAAGGVAGKAVEAVVDLANRTFLSRFAEQRENTKRQAIANGQDLVSKIEEGFQRVDASNAAVQRQIDRVLGSPAFAMFAQTTLFNGMTTDSSEKHLLLARLVIDRLHTESESLLAFTAEMASSAITRATAIELRILGLRSTIDRLNPSSPSHFAYPEKTNWAPLEWVTGLFSPYESLTYTNLDILQLHALGCLQGQTGMLAPDFRTEITGRGRLSFTLQEFEATTVGAHISDLWTNHRLVFVNLNSVGLLIGIFVSDVLHNTVTDLSQWKS